MLTARHYSITTKLTRMNMLVSGAALLLACAAFGAYDLISFREGMVHDLSIQAEVAGSNSVSALVFSDPASAEHTLSSLKAAPNIISATIYSPDGELFAMYSRSGRTPNQTLPAFPPGQTEAHWFEDGQLVVVREIVFQGKPTGAVVIRSDLEGINYRLKHYAGIAGIVLLVSLIAALLVSSVFQRAVAKPIIHLAEIARVVSRDRNYSVRATSTEKRDEPDVLIHAFNEMLEQIQERDGALQQAKHELEERVQARTAQLAAANKELESQNREVERATQLKSKFLASMSHELRTPLNAIVGFSELLFDGTAGPLTDKQKRFVNHIKLGSAHLLQLINDILDLSKIEAGQLELHCEEFLVKDALPEVLSTIRPLAMAKNIQVEENVTSDVSIHADRVRFKQVLYNLLSNAVKFTPRDGRISIDCEQAGTFASITVTDTGIGIQEKDQAIIFQEFRQIEGPAGTLQEGTGLGLAITKRLVEQQGGRISLTSEFTKGSRFTFTVPVSAEKVSPLPEPIVAAPVPILVVNATRSKPMILVVDDEAAARELVASYLEPDYQVVTATSGAEALVKALELRPDAITLDVLMAKGSGFETLVALRKTPATAGVPIIILSMVDQKQVGFALGATDYLVKPIRKPMLLETIRKYVLAHADGDSTILLVDDDPKTLELMEETLRTAGYKTQAVQSGAQALEALSSRQVSAVLLDLLMPEMDGFQVLRHIRQDDAFKSLPIFVMTAKNLSPEETDLLRQEAQALFQKDGTWQQRLLAEVSRVTRGKHRAQTTGGK